MNKVLHYSKLLQRRKRPASSSPWLGVFMLIGSCFGTSAQPASPSLSYDVSGVLRRQVFVDGKLYNATTNDFEVQVRGASSRIVAKNIPNEGIATAKSYEFTTDGTISCFVISFDFGFEVVEKSQKLGKPKLFSSFVSIYTNSVPPNNTGYMGPVWLATASWYFLKLQGEDGGYLHPQIFMSTDWPDVGGPQLKASWSIAGQLPHLPETLVEYADNETFARVSDFYKRWKKSPFPPAYATGYTNAIYKVSNWTNVNGLRLPTQFQMTGFIPQFAGVERDQLQVQITYEGLIQSVTTSNLEPVTLPSRFSAWSRIDEYRYGTIMGSPIVYASESGVLLSKDEVLDLKDRFSLGLSVTQKTNKIHRNIIRWTMALIIVFPACGLFLKFLTRQKSRAKK